MCNESYRPEEETPVEGVEAEDTKPAEPQAQAEPQAEFHAQPQAEPWEQPAPKKEKKQRFWPKAIALCLVCAILGGAAGVAGSALVLSSKSGNTTTIYESDREPTVVEVSYTNTGKELSLEEIYASWVNSTVGISTEIVTTNIFGQQVSAAAGSGFVISSDGYIVTNYHVIEGASTIKVTFYDGSQYDATLIGGEESNDVAVLKIDAQGLTPVIIGDTDDLYVGQTVTAIGNPLGELTFSQTMGIVSAMDRAVTLSDGTTINMLQTDCTINSGNSGGPLFNSYGEVVGITSAKYSNNGESTEATIEGIGFAIPMNDVIGIIEDLIEHGYVTGKPNVGVLLNDVDAAAQRYGIPAGAEVMAILEGSCAEKGGLQVGDIITALGDTTVESTDELKAALSDYQAGDVVTMTVYRDRETVELQLTLDESNQERSDALNALNKEYSSQQQQQSGSGAGSGNSSIPGFTWPFGR